MRNFKIALLAIGTIISLISLRDKAMVPSVPNARPPLVAEAYHSPQGMWPPRAQVFAPAPAATTRKDPQVLTGSPSASTNIESGSSDADDSISGLLDIQLVEQAGEGPVPYAAASGSTAAPDSTIIYGLGGTVSAQGNTAETNTDDGTSSGDTDTGTTDTPAQAGSGGVFITGLTPNSGIPGTYITIQGAGFSSTVSNNVVKFGTFTSGSVAYISANQLRAAVPQGVAAGFTNVSVSVSGADSNNSIFDVLKSSGSNVFIDSSQDLLPAGINISGSSIVTAGDADNDKDLDLVIADTAAGTVYLLVNDGQGTFTDETSSCLPAVTGPSYITGAVFSDVNLDGYQDIILSYSNGRSVRLFLNDCSGKFTDVSGANLPVISGNAAGLDIEDCSGDGAPDIIIANKDAKDVLLINNGSGIFVKDAGFGLPGTIDGSSAIKFCDIDNDGDQDIITTNNEIIDSSSLRNRLYINDGQGQFTDGTESSLPEDDEYSEVLDYGDIDQDGDMDIIVGNYSQNAVLINAGDGTFSDQTAQRISTNDFASRDTKLGDMNGDGYQDIVMLGEDRISLLFNDGLGYFTENSLKLPDYKSRPALLGGESVEIADINGDGCLDIIIGGNSLYILINDASDKAPVLGHIGDKTVEFGKNLTFNVTASDPNGDVLIFLAENLPGGATFLSKIFSWTPTLNDVGRHNNIRFIAREDTSAALEAFEDITITVIGLPPVIDSYIPEALELNLTLGQIVQFGIIAHDPSQGELIFRWFLNGTEASSISGFSSSLMFIVPRMGENIIEARAENSSGSASVYWHVNVGVPQNLPPVITGYDPPQSTVNIDLTAGGVVNFAVTADDPEGDSLSYEWRLNGAALLSSGSGLSSSAFIGSLGIGDHMLQALVSDGYNAATTRSWTIHVTQGVINGPPAITNYEPQQPVVDIDIDAGGAVNFAVTAEDPDGDSLLYEWKLNGAAIPSSGAVLNSSAFIGSIGVGDHALQVSVSDGHNPAVTNSWTIHVTQVSPGLELTEEVMSHSFNYLWNETDNPDTGFIRDRLLVNAADPSIDNHYYKASMAATGFGLAALCVAAERYGDGTDPDWQTSPEDLAARAELILDKLLDIQSKQASEGDATWGKNGLFYHFVNINTAERWVYEFDRSEVSSIDTAILVAGALTAGEYFKTIDPDINTKARLLYENVDWNSFLDCTSEDHQGRLYKSWKPESGFEGHWDYNDESVLLYLLAIGSPEPEHAISPDLYYSIHRELGSYGADGKAVVQTWFGSLFAYQYVNAFFDLRNIHDARNINWWQNATEATKANRQFCIDQDGVNGYNRYVWGLSSSYAAGEDYVGDYGASPLKNNNMTPRHDGFVNPSVVVSAIGMLTPEVVETLAYMKSDPDLWKQDSYGFVDSFKNSDPRIYSNYFVGLDLGAALVMAANHSDSGLVWNNFMNASTRYGTMHDLLIQLNFRPDTDPTLYIDVDDTTSKSQFAYGLMSSDKPVSSISFNLEAVVPGSKYLVAIHAFMNDFIGDYQTTVNVSVNGHDEGNQVFSHNPGQADEIKYIEIDSLNLQEGENAITLTWQSGESWIAWKNFEISAPAINNEWIIVKSVYANEYRLDDTYYTGHFDKYGAAAYKTFEKALNYTEDPYTDILFYIDDLSHDRKLTLLTSSSEGDASVNIAVNGQTSSEDTVLSAGQPKQVIIPADRLKEGWNCLRLAIKMPGSTWLIWDTLVLELGDPASLSSPSGLAAASFGRDKANLRWNSARGTNVRYNLYRSQDAGGPYTKINTSEIDSTQYQDASLTNNTKYYYVVSAFEESAPGEESAYSAEISVTTGPYQLDYKDGRDPNIFGGYTLDNAGTQLGDNAFIETGRYDGTTGKVRRFNLLQGQKNTVDLNGAGINDATMLLLRIKGNAGGEKFQIKFKDNSGSEASVSLTIPAGGVWQEKQFYIETDFDGLDLSNMQAMEIISETPGSQINICLDEVEFATIDIAGDRLDVKIRNGADDTEATGVNFGTTTVDNSCVLSGQYIEIEYTSSGSWGIQIYTDNKAPDAYPRFTGTGGLANGLVGTTDSASRVPVLWQVWQDKRGYYNGTETPEFDTTDKDGDRAEFAFAMDKSDPDWADEYAQNYRTLINNDGELGAPVPLASGGGYHPRIGDTGEPIYVYLAADFTGAPAQTYTTNKLTIDIYHE